MADSREKKLNKILENQIKLQQKPKKIRFKMNEIEKGSYLPLKIENLTFGYNENKNLFENLNIEIYRGERFLILGENGVGKSTILKLIANQLKPNSGEIKTTEKTKIGYYDQEHESLQMEKTVLENFIEFNLSDSIVIAH